MNLGLVMLALLLVGGSIFAIFAIAQANQDPVVDSFGQVQGNETNSTQALISNSTTSVAGAGGGLVVILAVFVIFIAAVFVIKAAFGNSSYNTRR
jgi:hypothetical protein